MRLTTPAIMESPFARLGQSDAARIRERRQRKLTPFLDRLNNLQENINRHLETKTGAMKKEEQEH